MSSSVFHMSMSLGFPVLLCAGRPLFVVDAPGVTHLRFRVKA